VAVLGAPETPPMPSGNSRNTSSVNTAAERSAIVVSRLVSWYSGAKVAHTSAAYDDQPNRNR